MIRQLRHMARQPLARNILILYVLRATNQLLPLATIPYLARVLGPVEWGMVAVGQAFAMYGIITIQYGFDLAGTREVARERANPDRLGELWAGVLGAQLVLICLVVAVAGIAASAVPAFIEQPRLLAAALLFAIVQGLSVQWFLIGMERVALMAMLELPTKMASLIGIFLVVDGPGDGWRVFAVYAAATLIGTGVSYGFVLQQIRPRWPGLGQIAATFRLGFSLFLMQVATVINTAGHAFLLSLLAPAQQVAFFAAPEKLSRPLAWLALPINRALLPRLSHLMIHEPARAHALARLALIGLSVLGVLLGLAVMLLAPWMVELVFGPGYEAAVPVLRVLALAMPLLIINDALGSQWLIPHGLDRPLGLIMLAAAGLTVALALLIVPHYHAYGMAWVAVLVELFILAGLLLALVRRRHQIARRVRPARGAQGVISWQRPS